MSKALLTKRETAEKCRAPVRTLDRWPVVGHRPGGFKAAKRVLYREADVDRCYPSSAGSSDS